MRGIPQADHLDDGVDPQGGIQYSRYERVRVERVWKEFLTKESETRPPASLAKARTSAEGFDPKGFEDAIRHKEKQPSKKFDLPLTRSHEIGWLIANPASAELIRARQRSKWQGAPPGKSMDKAASTSPAFHAASSSSTAQGNRDLASTGTRAARSASMPVITHLPAGPPHSELQQLNAPRWRRPRVACPITQYADTYVGLMRCNPFDQVSAGR